MSGALMSTAVTFLFKTPQSQKFGIGEGFDANLILMKCCAVSVTNGIKCVDRGPDHDISFGAYHGDSW